MSVPPRHPTTVPSGATSVRPAWDDLPAGVRTLVEERCGAQVAEARSQGGGFTPGFASRLLLDDGRRVFVKAADDGTRGIFAAAYRNEVQVLPHLPAAVPAPRLQWTHDRDGWVVVAFDDVEGRHPRRPWQPAELQEVLDMLTTMAATLTPAPEALHAPTFGAEFADVAPMWKSLDLPEAAEAFALATAALPAFAGDTLVHTDVREDNLLLDGDSRVWLCDWNWVCTGAPWIDTMSVLLSAYGDGLDAEDVVATHPLLRDVPADVLDGFLALLAGYFFTSAADDVPVTSPFIRDHQRWYATVTWNWLSARRGWL